MDDLISRKAAIDAVLSEERYCERNMDGDATAVVQMARFKVEKVPVVDAVPVVHAYWIEKRWTTEDDWGCTNHFSVVCSACSNEIYKGMKSPYCPNCGAKMDEEG